MTHPLDDIEAFALGALDAQTADNVLAHADSCPSCAVLLADALHVVAKLSSSEQRPLPEGSEARLMSRVNVVSRPHVSDKRSPWLAWSYGALATAAALLLLLWNLNLRSHSPLVPIAALVNSHFTHHPLAGPLGKAKVLQAIDGHWLYLVADHLKPNTSYEFYETIAGVRRKVGDFKSDGEGSATAYWEQHPARINAFFVVSANVQEPGELRWP